MSWNIHQYEFENSDRLKYAFVFVWQEASFAPDIPMEIFIWCKEHFGSWFVRNNISHDTIYFADTELEKRWAMEFKLRWM